jgi:hypothetical protein
MNNNQTQLANISKTLGDIVGIVYTTYSKAIKFIVDCAADLGSLGLYAGAEAGAILIPVAGEIGAGALAAKAIDTFSSFIKNVGDLISSSVAQIGDLKASVTSLAASGKSFQALSKPGTEVGHTGSWQVENRKPQ